MAAKKNVSESKGIIEEKKTFQNSNNSPQFTNQSQIIVLFKYLDLDLFIYLLLLFFNFTLA